MKKKLLVSFSGGETSAFMAQWLWTKKRDEYEMVFVFANTGQENEETLLFTERCSAHFGFPVVWIEADVDMRKRKGTRSRVVSFASASRDGSPFRDVISKYGIPNMKYPHCTRELKEQPITHFARTIGWKRGKYLTAIGIREDEIDRMSSKRKEKGFIYPLVSMQPMNKPMINFWWSQQPFRLELKGYQGNCKTCWKKGINKLYQIAKEHPSHFDFFRDMETEFGSSVSQSRLEKSIAEGKDLLITSRFFRGGKSVDEILAEAQVWDGVIKDDAANYDSSGIQLSLDLDGESCEVFSSCRE